MWYVAIQKGVPTMNFTIQPVQPTHNSRKQARKNDANKKESGHEFLMILQEYASANAARSRRDGFAGSRLQLHESPDDLMKATLHALTRVNNELTSMLF